MVFHLSAEQKHKFEDEGCLVIENFMQPETVQQLLNRSKELVRDFPLEGHPMTVFATGAEAEEKHVGDEYFLSSGDKVHFFFEKDAFTDGKLNRDKHLAVNKFGHSLHTLEPAFRDFTLANPDVQSLARSLAFHQDPRVIQSMVICKQPSIGGEVNSHDDSTFLYTEPLSALGFWFALEDATPENGCLSFVPGSHKINKIHSRLERVEGGGTEIRKIPLKEGEVEPELPKWDEESRWVSAPVKAGDLVLIHGSVIHRSEANRSAKSRYIYTFHMIEGSAHWPETNWLQPTPGVPFTKLYSP